MGYFYSRKELKERRKKIKEVKRQFIPLDGSVRWIYRERGGQRWVYYLKDIYQRIRLCWRTTRERVVWGSAITDYYNLDIISLQFLRNGILALKHLNISYPGEYNDDGRQWGLELERGLTLLNSYLDNQDTAVYHTLMEWLTINLPKLWD